MDDVKNAGAAFLFIANKKFFKPGDELQIICTPPVDGYLTILSHTLGKEKITVLFPNKGKQENKVSGGKAVNIPRANDDFKLRADHDAGKTIIVAYLHHSPGIYNPFTNHDLPIMSTFVEVEVTGLIKRGFN
jgi:hypothetical protein